MFDKDLATLYEVKTKELNKAVSRNTGRFPSDFVFRLTAKEYKNLRFHFGTSNRGGRRYLPYAFTEQGIAMLSSVLNSERAIQVNIAIMRIFVRLKQMVLNHKELATKLTELEHKIEHHDAAIVAIFDAIRQIMKEEEKPKKKFGFV